ncbi:hypothetical protein SAMN05216251_13615 [Actinacidiphila alni]|uniref:Uncharacterized protein n=1 Tax=Actinacidiphila alni TaxID=380248 RepID=A0A1I2MH81_9ACTN|nr:hypothetical protein [Actinacidiphila alni]SFF90885.1 hypothetical protein SAMN05216251_13615 [Actinacidiphila alni]
MTKAGASGPKARARKAQKATGAPYTEVRARQASRAGRRGDCRVMQFLTENSTHTSPLLVQFAGVWARQGLKVLLLSDYQKPYAAWRLQQHSRNAKTRKEAEAQLAAWPGPRSTLLWRPEDGNGGGFVNGQRTPWSSRVIDADRGADDVDGFADALARARSHFDVVVLADRFRYPWGVQGARYIVLAHSDEGIPVSATFPPTYDDDTRLPRHALTPQQSAALLRDRHLRFLGGSNAVPLLGMVTCHTGGRGTVPDQPGPAFRAGVEADMESVGLPLLGHIALPTPDQLVPAGAAGFDQTVRTVLAASPADDVTAAARKILRRW